MCHLFFMGFAIMMVDQLMRKWKGNIMIDINKLVSVCPKCGKVYYNDFNRIYDLEECEDCDWSLLTLPLNDSVAIAYALLIADHPIEQLLFPNEYYKERMISLKFDFYYDFSCNPPPRGFVCGYEQNIETGRNYSTVRKKYPCDMSPMAYSRKLIADKNALMTWIYKFPYLRNTK